MQNNPTYKRLLFKNSYLLIIAAWLITFSFIIDNYWSGNSSVAAVRNNIENYVKYNYFDKDQSSKADKKYPFRAENLFYNKDKDSYYCPMGQAMQNTGTHQIKTRTGFTQTITRYQAANCKGCPLRGICHKSKGNRVIEINHALNKYREQARENLNSEKGIYHRKKRCADVEPVFANIKNNHHFKRFMLRSKPKVEIETGLLALAHNLRKKAA